LAEHGLDGFKIEQLLEALPGLTYDDFLLLPGHIYFSPQVVAVSNILLLAEINFISAETVNTLTWSRAGCVDKHEDHPKHSQQVPVRVIADGHGEALPVSTSLVIP
jgi:hypothetical protein